LLPLVIIWTTVQLPAFVMLLYWFTIQLLNGTADASNPASPGSCGKWVVAEPAMSDHSSVAVPPCSWLRASLEAIHSLVSGRFQHRLPERELH